jgi:hypothetical protein
MGIPCDLSPFDPMPEALVTKEEADFDDEEDACEPEAFRETLEVQVCDKHRDDESDGLPTDSFHQGTTHLAG